MSTPQRGMALLVVVAVLALASFAVYTMTFSQTVNSKRTFALVDSDRSWWVARGVADWVVTLLERDAQENDFDHLGEFWAQPVDYLPVDDGFVTGQVFDQSGLFNLNNLALGGGSTASQRADSTQVDGGTQPTTPDAAQTPATADGPYYQGLFVRMLEQLINAPGSSIRSDAYLDPQAIANAVTDWVDADIEPRFPGGAEDDTYTSADTPYRAANRPFQSVSELRLVHGMTPELYAALRPLVTALPELTTINVNTAPREVLMAIFETPSPGDIDAFIESRQEEPAESIESLEENNRLGAQVSSLGLAVQSTYFIAEAQANVGSGRVALYSLVHRTPQGDAQILSQSRDTY